MKKESIQIRIEPDVLDGLDTLAEKEDRSRSYMANLLIKQGIEAAKTDKGE